MGSDDLHKKSKKRRAPEKIKTKRSARTENQRLLIVCEGGKTEPNYFREMIKDFRINATKVEVTGECGSDPVSVVKYAKKLYDRSKKEEIPFGRVYCVFDRDHYHEQMKFQQALSSLQQAKFSAIYSIPCFEYWLLLHFKYIRRPFEKKGKKSPADCVMSELKKSLPNYQKGDNSIFMQTKDMLETAKKNAKIVIEEAKKDEEKNPSTKIHELIAYLENLKQD